MVILGLTGSIGMGKSVAAAIFRRLGVPVFDADDSVHVLLGQGGDAVGPIAEAFPGVLDGDRIDRAVLAKMAFRGTEGLMRLESILHPMVTARQRRFLLLEALRGRRMTVLDIPLLFETQAEGGCDAVIVVSAPRFVQRQRVLGRPGMTPEQLQAIERRQMTDSEKRRRADYVVPSGQGRRVTLDAIRAIIEEWRPEIGTHWPPRRYVVNSGRHPNRPWK